MTDNKYTPTVLETIERLRRSILVHSYIYYARDLSIVTDDHFDSLMIKLEQLQKQYPQHNEDNSFRAEEFKDFNSSSGYYLNYRSPEISSVGERLLRQMGY